VAGEVVRTLGAVHDRWVVCRERGQDIRLTLSQHAGQSAEPSYEPYTLWRRDCDGRTVQKGLIHHADAASAQHTSFRFTTHLLDAGIDASIGAVGDALDNALMESTIGLDKTELIKPPAPS
jgi:transposase InsO family protein